MFILDNDFTSNSITEVKPLNTGKLCLFDADFLKYVLVDRVWKRENETGVLPPMEVVAEEMIYDILKSIQDPIIFCFSGKSYNTFRASISFEKEYKGNRKDKPDYRHYDRKQEDMANLISYMTKNFSVAIYNDLEADDIVSMLQDNKNTYILSKDKDLKQVPGFHYDETKNDIYYVSEEEAFKFLMKQLLVGDSTDNIPGVKGIGPAKASTILNGQKPSDQIMAVISEYIKSQNSLTKGIDMFCEQWMLIKTRMKRGEYFLSKYELIISHKENVINYLKEI